MWKVQNDSIPTRVVNTNSLRKVFMFILTYDVGQKSLEDDRCALAIVPTRASALGLCFLLPHTVPRISNDDLRTHEGALSFCKKPPQDDTRDTP